MAQFRYKAKLTDDIEDAKEIIRTTGKMLLEGKIDKPISFLLKTYLVTAVFILMCITSLGIYGFLVSAYQETAYELKNLESRISVLQLKQDRYQTLSDNIRVERESLNENISQLTSGLSNNVIQYTNEEGRVITTTSSATRNVLQSQLDQSVQRRDTLYSQEIVYSDSIGSLDQQMLKIQTESEVTAEIGPIKYIAQRVNRPVDTVVNWFILLFIFVFDPLAVMLLISATRLIGSRRTVIKEPDAISPHVEDTIIKPVNDDVGTDGYFEDNAVYTDLQSPEQSDIPDIVPVEELNDIYGEEKKKEKPKRVILRSEKR